MAKSRLGPLKRCSLAVTLALGASCGTPTGATYTWPVLVTQAPGGSVPLMAGTSSSDIWVAAEGAGANLQKVSHFNGSAWTTVPVPLVDQDPNSAVGVAVAAKNEVWLAATKDTKTVLVRVGLQGLIEDHSAEIAATSLPARGSLVSRGGGVFLLCDDTAATSKSVLYQFADGKFSAVMNTPKLFNVPQIAMLGPDEIYFGDKNLSHYHAGTWSSVPFDGTNVFSIAFSASTDVWFWFPTANAGGSGIHGDGMAWTEFAVLNWPAPSGNSAGPSALSMVSKGDGKVAFLTNMSTGTQLYPTDNIAEIHVDDMQKVTGEDLLVATKDCAGEVCYSDGVSRPVTLDDGSLLFPGTLTRADSRLADWYLVKP